MSTLYRELTVIILFSIFFTETALAGEARTLQSFGVQVLNGQPVYPLPSRVVLGLYDPDPLLDLACYANGKVQIWKNLGNGTFGNAPVFEQRVSGVVEKVELKKSRMWSETIFDINSWSDLVLTFTDGRTQSISHEWMNTASRSFAAMPQQACGSPPLNFTEVWRSPPNPGLGMQVLVTDIDGNGGIEIIHMAYPAVGDSIRRIRVYKNVADDSLAVAWDTSVVTLSGVFDISDLDNNGHKEIVTAYFPRGVGVVPRIALLECFGAGQFRFYDTNIGFDRPIFEVKESDIDHDGVKELIVLTSDPNRPLDPTIIYVAKYSGKFPNVNGWIMTFSSQELARYQGYAFDMAVGQLDGQGRDEIIPAGGSFGFNEPAPIDYLWYSGIPGPQLWRTRRIHTGLQSGTGAVMFVNLDVDTAMEFVSGAPGPVGHGSMFALKYVSDTTWSVLWADSSLRNAPLWVNEGNLSGTSVVAGANSYNPNFDTVWSKLNVYHKNGNSVGRWLRDSASIQQFHLLDIDEDGRTDLFFAQASHFLGHRLLHYESDSTVLDVNTSQNIPERAELLQNYPNPFNSRTIIRFRIPNSSTAQLTLHDVLGRHVATLLNEYRERGNHKVEWDATNYASGIYFYRLQVEAQTITRKMLLLR